MVDPTLQAEVNEMLQSIAAVQTRLNEIDTQLTDAMNSLKGTEGRGIFGPSEAGKVVDVVFTQAVATMGLISTNSQNGAQGLVDGTRQAIQNIRRGDNASVDTMSYAQQAVNAARATDNTYLTPPGSRGGGPNAAPSGGSNSTGGTP